MRSISARFHCPAPSGQWRRPLPGSRKRPRLGFGRAVLPESARGDLGATPASPSITVGGLTTLVADIAARAIREEARQREERPGRHGGARKMPHRRDSGVRKAKRRDVACPRRYTTRAQAGMVQFPALRDVRYVRQLGRHRYPDSKVFEFTSGPDQPMPITILDLVLLAVMLISGLLAMVRGFMREILSIAAWGTAAGVTLYSFSKLLPTAKTYFQ